ncbi:RUS family member 1 [Helicoverpa armigera]|uniref:RUS family member 1 n=1 Tax=Helicoverpa armigera TaxID=29058 RepID=UPI000B3A7B30|nr:hypothetical protein B5X24_HaOG216069 [Helicoverpa armigera]
MYTIHEGEIIYKEIYGTANRQRFYVKPPDQNNVVIVDEENQSEIASLFTRVFLPQGYPKSVSKDYTNYQVWDTAQAFCSTITGILATQEVLRGVGVGDTSATPLAATVTWVLKDGCGHLGKIFFAYSHGSYLDAYSKKWRLYADTLNDAAMCMELALPAFKNYTTLVLCASTVMKAIVGVAGGATRAAMTQHHAVRGNLADVTAKDSAQETAVNLIASLTALLIITAFGGSLTIFIIMMILHIIFNYLAVRSVCLRTLNEPRFLNIVDTYLREEAIAKPCTVNRNEPVVLFGTVGSGLLVKALCGFRIKIGCSMKELAKRNPKADHMRSLQEVYENTNYIIVPCLYTNDIYIFLRDSARTDSILCSYFHAILFGIVICAINEFPLTIYDNPDNVLKPFPIICEALRQADWTKEPMESPCNKFSHEPSLELMSYLNKIVEKEWPIIKAGLERVGWDLKKHLLIVDEWRLRTAKLITNNIEIAPEDNKHINTNKVITFDVNDGKVEKKDGHAEDKTYTIEPESSDVVSL